MNPLLKLARRINSSVIARNLVLADSLEEAAFNNAE